MNPKVIAFVHDPTSSLTYAVEEPNGQQCAVVDPGLDHDNHASRASTTSIDRVIDYIKNHGLKVDWVIETHAHGTVAQQRENNIIINVAVGEEDFVKFRTARDKQLAAPKLLFQSVQINIRAGQLPSAESSGIQRNPAESLTSRSR